MKGGADYPFPRHEHPNWFKPQGSLAQITYLESRNQEAEQKAELASLQGINRTLSDIR